MIRQTPDYPILKRAGRIRQGAAREFTFYLGPNAPRATIDKLTFNLGPSQLSEADKKAVEEAYAKGND
jgi:hypothetical protein